MSTGTAATSTTVRSPEVWRRRDRLRGAAVAFGGLLVAVGTTVLLGWLADVELMKSFGPGLLAMKVHTAFGLIEVGALTMLAGARGASAAGAWLAPLVAIVPALTLVEDVVGTSLGIDNVFGADHVAAADLPGRMSPLTAVGLVLLSLGLAGTFLRRHVAAQWAGAGAVLLSLVAVVGYLFGVEQLHRVHEYVSIALHTSVCLGIGGLALLALNTSAGILSVVVGATAGGVVARALLPPIALFQVLASGLALLGVTQGGFYDYRFGFALVAVANVVGGVALVLLLAYVLRNSDLRRAGAEAALEHAQEQSAQLVATNAVLDDFAAMAAHDLRGPLAAVRGYAELLEDLGDTPSDPAARRDLVDRIRRAAGRGDEMITDMLAFARLGARPPAHEVVDLAEEVRAIAVEVAEVEHRPVRLEIGTLPTLSVDRSMIRLLLANVLANAAKYVPAGRSVEVAVDAIGGEGGETVIRFVDNGDGIGAVDRDRLLRMFERGQGTAEVPGTGIGLAICARVAAVHDGRFWIEDAPGGGAQLCLALPAQT